MAEMPPMDVSSAPPMVPDAMGTPPAVDPRYDLQNPDTVAKVLSLIREDKQAWGQGREPFVRAALRNLLFARGHQWIVWNRGMGGFRPMDPKTYPGPRPMTNKFDETMRAYAAVLARVEPTITYRPATDAPEDRATAEVSGRCIEVAEAEQNYRLQRQLLAHTVAYTGEGWIELGYDPDPRHGTRLVPHATCLACGATSPPAKDGMCALCGGPTEPAVDDQGQPVGHEAPVGKLVAEVRSIFEMWADFSITDWTKQRKCYVEKSLSRSAAIQAWGDVARGVTSDTGAAMGDAYGETLPTMAGFMPEVGAGSNRSPGTGTRQTGRVTEGWYHSLPTEEYPEGLLAGVLGGTQCVYLGPLPYTNERGPFLPFVNYPSLPMPGSGHSKTVADDLAIKQVQRNQVEALIMMILMRTANPVWLVPQGSNIARFTGMPGQVLEYTALGPNPAKPERVQGASVPNGLITWLQMIDGEFESLAATYSIMKGDRPAGVSAGISLQMLQERANSRFGSMFILWEQAEAARAQMTLDIFRQYVTEARLRKVQGRDSRWRIEQFLGADLTGRVDVVPEAGSSTPRSTLVERAELEQLASMGVINPRDPETQQKWLETYGRLNWLPGMKADAENAAKQLEQFEQLAQDPNAVQMIAQVLQAAAMEMQRRMQMAQMAPPPSAPGMGAPMPSVPPPPITYNEIASKLAQQQVNVPLIRPRVDGHMIMVREYGNWLKGDASQQLPPPIQDLVERKHAEHWALAQQEQMQALQMQQGTFPTSGFLSNPGGQGSSTPAGPPSRMVGEQQEMEQHAQ